MKHFLQLFLLITLCNFAIAQDSQRNTYSFSVGLNIPTGNELSKVYGNGVTLELGASRKLNKFIMVKPMAGYSRFASGTWYERTYYPSRRMHFFNVGLNASLVYQRSENEMIYT